MVYLLSPKKEEDKNKARRMQQRPYIVRLNIHTMVPPVTDPPGGLQRADEVSTILRMLADAQTSTLALTGDPGAGTSTITPLLYQRLDAATRAGQVARWHFAFLTLV